MSLLELLKNLAASNSDLLDEAKRLKLHLKVGHIDHEELDAKIEFGEHLKQIAKSKLSESN